MLKFKSQHLGLPLTFTTYTIEDGTLYIKEGLLNTSIDMVRLYSIRDMRLERNVLDWLFNQGTIIIESNDNNNNEVLLKRVNKPERLLRTLNKLVASAKNESGFSIREVDTL